LGKLKGITTNTPRKVSLIKNYYLGFFLPAKIVGVAGQRQVLANSIPKVEQPTYGVGFFIIFILWLI
jgi:hypothetical protein